MNIYNYDYKGHYTITTEARLDPLDGNPMIPAHATSIAVPEAELETYERYKFDGTAWVVDKVQSIIDGLLETVNEKGTALYELDENQNPVERSAQDIADDDAEADKEVLRVTAYSDMNTDIYTELQNTFGTKKSETATAMAMTWDLMKAEPAEYHELGLKSDFDLTGISKGDALDTEAKVLDYATQLVDKKKAYSKYRLQRIKQFNDEITSIG